MTDDPDLAERLAALERRVAALEGRPAESIPDTPGGVVGYQGELTEPGELRWAIRLAAPAVLALPDGPRVEVLAALANPVRIALVRALAQDGAQTGAALQEAAGLGSPGQLYHHLKALTSAGLVEQDRRGSYRLRPAATIPALVLLTAAADVAGQLRPGVRNQNG
ncbi:ArsR/SmtB family transcription factor [Amycolatopsis saalfeldensis]|uniref:DNA-binding transcriptional regulator, ArsR family n=1 Tax=Amycolatopsis saalfeldensis TaxID=394193 RepID=A0A1H8YPT1_9PSEU|nr:helix-turn-helix domain-containing protein [Amycolatopsis saalfeldensis]SEP54214.1 DNA-binding transcriptional regulator, ArsR family [Amycolatopsis saalfeldensis]